MLKDNEPYQLEYILNDKASGDSSCLMSQVNIFNEFPKFMHINLGLGVH